MKISLTSKYSMGIGAALILAALPLAVSAKAVTPSSAVDTFRLAVQAPAGADLSTASDQAVKVARRIRRGFRAGQRGGWRTLRNRHGGASTSRSFTNAHSRSGRSRSGRRIRNLHGGPR